MPSSLLARVSPTGLAIPHGPCREGLQSRGSGPGRGFPSGRRAGASATRIASTGDRFAESQSGESKAWTRTLRMAVSAPAQSRSYGVWFVREAFRPDDRTATEVSRPVPFKGLAFYSAIPERWSWSRTSDTMIINHLLYPSELSSFADRPESNRTQRVSPALSPESFDHCSSHRRNTRHAERAAPAGTRARTQGRSEGAGL